MNRCCLFWQWWYMMGFFLPFYPPPPEKWHRESHIWAHGWGMWMEGRWGAGTDSKYADRRDGRTPKDCRLFTDEYWIYFLKEHSFTLDADVYHTINDLRILISISVMCESSIYFLNTLPVSQCLTVFLPLASLMLHEKWFTRVDQAGFWWANVITEPGWNEREGQGGRWEERWGEGGPQRHPWVLVNGFQKRGPSQRHVAGVSLRDEGGCSQQTDLLPPAGQVMSSTELFKYSAGSGNWNRLCLDLNVFLLYRSTMNPSSNIYKTLKYTFQIQDSQWWVISSSKLFFFSFLNSNLSFGLISRASH